MIEKIETHVQDAINRLIQQYKCADNLQEVIKSIVEQIQIIEDEVFVMFSRLDINNSSGKILDLIGEIIGQPRNGLEDDFYRVFLSIKIGVNTSNGNPEKVIDIFKLLSNSSSVNLQEFYPAAIGLESDGNFENLDIQSVYELIQRIVPAGVRVDSIASHDPDCYFSMAGDLNSGGFSSVAEPEVGGCLGFLLDVAKDFGFGDAAMNENPTIDGFGSIKDSIVGGKLVSL